MVDDEITEGGQGGDLGTPVRGLYSVVSPSLWRPKRLFLVWGLYTLVVVLKTG